MISPIERPLDWQRPSSSAAVRKGRGSSFLDSSSSFRAASSSPFADDEAAAHREERRLVHDFAVGVGDGERHAVGVPRQDGQGAQDHVLDAVGQRHGSGELQGAGLGDRGEPFFDFFGQDALRVEAFQAEQDGGHGAVAVAGGGERTVEVHAQRRHLGPGLRMPSALRRTRRRPASGPRCANWTGLFRWKKGQRLQRPLSVPNWLLLWPGRGSCRKAVRPPVGGITAGCTTPGGSCWRRPGVVICTGTSAMRVLLLLLYYVL